MGSAGLGVVVIDTAVGREMHEHVDSAKPLDQRRLADIDEPPRRLGNITADRVDRDHFFHGSGRRKLAHEKLPDAVCGACHSNDRPDAARSRAAPWANRLLFVTHRLPRTTTLDDTDVVRATPDR